MNASWKTVGVFISSTFRDMHAERDHLVKVVFPALREELEKHRVHLVDIDLRWGVTKEQADNDEALDVCLDQIDTCRPFFIGILGERYGYVSSRLPDRVASKYGWIRHHSGKSITELEILYGVLNNPQMHSRALFLFRDNTFLKDVPSDKRKDLEAEDDPSAAKLKNLKQAMRDARLPVIPYCCEYGGLKASGDVQLKGLDEFGRQIAEWLGPAIKAELKLRDERAPAEADPLAEERDFHERFMDSRLRVYVGREQINDALTAFVERDEPVACLVTGPSGSGKSAALARFVTDYRQKHPQTLLVPHFIGASPASTNPRQLLRRLCLSLKNVFGFAEEVPQDFNELATLFRDFLTRIPAERRTVFVLDALNQLDVTDNAQSLYWLPRELPGHVKLIASCIDDGDQSEPILQAFAHRPYHLVPVQALADNEQRQIIRAVPSLSAKTLVGWLTELKKFGERVLADLEKQP